MPEPLPVPPVLDLPPFPSLDFTDICVVSGTSMKPTRPMKAQMILSLRYER